jgi:cytochrome c-type biogenesis protein CcmH
MKRSFIFALFLSLLAVLLVAGAVGAQGEQPRPVTQDEVNAIAKQLYCPVCENIPLDVCPTQACIEWRELIRDKLAEGWTEPQIKQYFVDQYGDRVLGTPPARGLNWLVYIIPPAAITAGLYILFRAMRAWTRPAPAAPDSDPAVTVDDDYVRRLEEELRSR